MSVTFGVNGIGGTIVAHVDCDGQGGLCADYGCYDYVETGVNVGQANAVSILAALEIDTDDMCGQMAADEFMGHVLLAMAFADDSELVGADDKTHGGARFVDFGRRAGYMTDTLSRLLAVAEQAASVGEVVSWS